MCFHGIPRPPNPFPNFKFDHWILLRNALYMLKEILMYEPSGGV